MAKDRKENDYDQVYVGGGNWFHSISCFFADFFLQYHWFVEINSFRNISRTEIRY